MLNRFTSLLRSLTGGRIFNDRASKDSARSRLQFVLVQDRAGLSSDEMSKFKSELIAVIDKYFNLESEKFDITYKREGDGTMLIINSPVQVRRAEKAAAEKRNAALKQAEKNASQRAANS